MNIRVSKRLKEELAWAIDKRFQITKNIEEVNSVQHVLDFV